MDYEKAFDKSSTCYLLIMIGMQKMHFTTHTKCILYQIRSKLEDKAGDCVIEDKLSELSDIILRLKSSLSNLDKVESLM